MLNIGDLVKLAPTLARRCYIVESSLTQRHAQYGSTNNPARHDDMYVVAILLHAQLKTVTFLLAEEIEAL